MSTNNPLMGNCTKLNKRKQNEALAREKRNVKASFCFINIERKPMTDRQAIAWNKFWDLLIEDAKNELAGGQVPANSKDGDYDYSINF